MSQDELVSENLLNEVSKLKAEIVDLKQSVKIKEEQLNKKNDDEIHFLRLIKKLEEENEKMKIIITNYGIENRYLKKERSDKDDIITKLNEKLLEQSKVIQSSNDDIDIRDANEDLKGNGAAKDLEIMVKSGEKCKDNLDCELCNLSFESTTHLKEHLDLHCGTCSHTFENIQKRKRHQQMFGHSS